MRNVLAFAASFAAVLLVAAIIRASVLSQDAGAPANAAHIDQPQVRPEKKENGASGAHEGHGETRPREKPTEQPVEKPGEIVDLCNESDPVSGEKLGETSLTLEHNGWRITFGNEESKKKFEKNPLRYYAKLSLEPTAVGKLAKVDASKYEKATAEKCAIMGGDIDPDGEVYILHRGFKVYFCCWSGCADEFLKDPAKHYAHYGLEEKIGKLAKK